MKYAGKMGNMQVRRSNPQVKAIILAGKWNLNKKGNQKIKP
ncbi:hypothetical protein ACIQAA_09335 [Neobacillus sp. NPDC093182]